MRKITFIINPISGTAQKEAVPHLIKEELASEEVLYEIIYTQYAGHAKEIAQQKASEGVDVIAAIGGDGTVNEVASALVHTNTALGIVPCGSGNGLARHLGIPLEVRESIRLLAHGAIRAIDYGKINNDLLFFCSCGVGFDALVSWKFAHSPSRGFLTYVNIALKENFQYVPESYRIQTDDGHEFEQKAFVVACGNASQYGNDAFIAPKASVQDGLLDLTLIAPIRLVDVPLLSYQLFNQLLDHNEKTHTIKCRKVRIIREKEGALHYDGEPILAPKEIDIEVVPQGLLVLAPKEARI